MVNATRSRGRPRKYYPTPCAHCGETFQPRSTAKGRPPQQYCSMRCARKARTITPACGTDAGYRAHRRNGEESCEPCRKAAREARLTRNRDGQRTASRRRRLRHQTSWDGVSDEEILDRDNWMCWICKRRIGKTLKYPHPRSASIDHLIPLALGGDDTAFNKKAAHLRCNITRQTGAADEHPMLNFSLDPDVEITPRKRAHRPRPCKICGELRDEGLACRLHEPVFYAACQACGTPIVRRWRVKPERQHTCRPCSVRAWSGCAADGCTASGSFGKGYCAPHYHRLKRYGDVFEDIPVAHSQADRYRIGQLISERLAHVFAGSV